MLSLSRRKRSRALINFTDVGNRSLHGVFHFTQCMHTHTRLDLAHFLLIDAVERVVIFLNIFKIFSKTKVFCFINIAAVFNIWQVIRKWLKQGKAQRERNSCNTTCQEDMLAKLSSIRTGTSTNAIVNYFYNVFTIAGKGIARKVLMQKELLLHILV